MAELKKSILGNVSGSLGELTFRQRNGKNIIAAKPSSFMPGSDPASVARRERFKLTVKLAKELNSLNEIKDFWMYDKPAALTAFNYMFKKNYPFIASDGFTSNPMIFPNYGFNVANPLASFNADSIDVTIDALGTNDNIDLLIETEVVLVSILCLKEPSNNDFDKIKLMLIKSDALPIQLDNPLTFTSTVQSQKSVFYNAYQTKQIYSSLLTKDANGQIIKYSNTFSS